MIRRALVNSEHLEAEAAGAEVELLEVGAQQRLAAGEAHLQAAEVGGLPQDVLDLRRGHLARRARPVARRQVDAAVDAVVVAALGELDVEAAQARGDRRVSAGDAAHVAAHGADGAPTESTSSSIRGTIAPLLSKRIV